MPELAEVEFFRRRWWEAGAPETVRRAEVWVGSRVFRGLGKELKGGAEGLEQILMGARMVESGAFGKQMWFVLEGQRDTGTEGQRGGRELRIKKAELRKQTQGMTRKFQISDFKFQRATRGELKMQKAELRKRTQNKGRVFGICDLRLEKAAHAGNAEPGDGWGERIWLGVHLGMTGSMRVEGVDYVAQKHDALVLRMRECALVFNDPRQFGRVRAWVGTGDAGRDGSPSRPRNPLEARRGTVGKGRTPRRGVPTRASVNNQARPPWLRNLPAEILSDEFTPELVRGVLVRHGRAPVKAVLLNQKYFPGVGNWMADEILWRARLAPGRRAGRMATWNCARSLTATIRRVTRDALRVIAGAGGKLPPTLNVYISDSWLFNHRWKDGGICPKTKQPLRREEIGGRTTCWSPAWQV